MGKIQIGGLIFSGDNISVENSKVFVNGKLVHEESSPQLKITVEGNIENLDCHNAVVNGNVTGDVEAHNVTCESIGGKVDAHNVTAGTIHGKVKAHKVKSL